jgi:hypothetical protein
MEATFLGFFGRQNWHLSLGTREFSFDSDQDLVVDSGGNDPGVFTNAHELLRPYSTSHAKALVVLDCEWEGSPGGQAIVDHISKNLEANGWAPGQFAVVAIEPELETWIWQDNVNVDAALGFRGPGRLREWLRDQGYWPDGDAKPPRPKETMAAVLRSAQLPPSSSIFEALAGKVGLAGCVSPSFLAMAETLRRWFPKEAP